MKALIARTLALACAVALWACAPQAPTHATTAAPPLAKQDYRCESGKTIAAAYPTTDSATIQFQGVTHHMHIAVSGSGARYVGDGLEWWTKGSGPGSTGTLFKHLADGTSGDRLEFCTAV